MEEYTPTTEAVREGYGWSGHDSHVESNRAHKRAEFDRWLGEYTASLAPAEISKELFASIAADGGVDKTTEELRKLVSEIRFHQRDWERVYGKPNYPENLSLAIQLANLVELMLPKNK